MTNGRDPGPGRDPTENTSLAIERRITRRRFLAGTGLGLGALALAACAPGKSSTAPSTGNVGDTLNLATWPNYHSQAVLDAFTAATGAHQRGRLRPTERWRPHPRRQLGHRRRRALNYAIEGCQRLLIELDYAKLPNFKRDD
jgi:spermidine/putrescine-binding protein